VSVCVAWLILSGDKSLGSISRSGRKSHVDGGRGSGRDVPTSPSSESSGLGDIVE